ncbi:glycosyl transferase family 1 [Maribacter hydrothermalis]|uniref:Glycosyl transferase family 1 n=1 Tax=Maribacter hydrothermalis TaxID=1836467 RepID=A0A1B7ZCE7_9FLAO|nr:glycosyl transferase family 1 [Maribacter hydrothermalis]OBR40594.1 glycosyl transferase family 1 [Maribacter hydrothermalis]
MLAVLHYPPPVHGAAMVGKFIMESNLINNKFKINYINLGTSTKVNEIGYGSFLKIKRYIKILYNTLKHLYKDKPKLVYITLTSSGAGFFKDAIVVFLSQIFSKKIVLHFHNKGVKTKQHQWLDNLFYRQVFKGSEVILLSNYLYEDVKKYVSVENVHICPNGIPLTNSSLKSSLVKNEVVQLLFLSNLIASKGVFDLLMACQILKNKRVPFFCRFIGNIGDISLAEFIAKVNELGLSDCVCYDGPKYGLEKEIAFENSDIFVFPTKNECFPLVLLEASQLSLPIISTNEGGIPDIVKNNQSGFLVERQDSLELAKKIELLITNSELRVKMGEIGKENFNEFFTLDKFEERFSQILEEIV